MITKNSWMWQNKLEDLREKMIDTGIVKIVDFPNYGEVFENVQVSVSYFLVQRGYKSDTTYVRVQDKKIASQYSIDLRKNRIIVSDAIENTIIDKTKSDQSFKKYVIGLIPFGIETQGKIQTGFLKGFGIQTSAEKSEEFNILLHFKGSDKAYVKYEDIPRMQQEVFQYKIVAGQKMRRDSKCLYNIRIIDPGEIVSGSQSLLFSSKNKSEAENAMRYIKTKFLRFLAMLSCDTMCRVGPYRFKLVPDQDFTSGSDIDWSQSVEDIDKQLYKKYNLTQEEIDYIEKTIRSLEIK